MQKKPRLLYLYDGRFPTEKASGYQTAQMCQAFGENGWETTLLVPRRIFQSSPGLSQGTSPKSYYNLRNDLTILRTPCIDFIYFLQSVLSFSDNHPLVRLGSVLTSLSIGLIQALLSFFYKADMIFMRSTHHFISVAIIFLIFPSALRAVAFEIHSLPSNRFSLKLLYFLLGKVRTIVTLNACVKELLVSQGIDANKVIVAHDGVDFTSFALDLDMQKAKEDVELEKDIRYLTYVGRFQTNGLEKGIPEIINAACHVLPRHSGLKFLFVGGPLDSERHYRGQIENLRLDQNDFVFLDKQPVAQIPYFLKASDILLMTFPKIRHYDEFMSPLKLFEYMSSNRPIVATNLRSIREVLSDMRNSLLADPADPLSIAEKINLLLIDADLRDKLARNALVDVQSYTWSARARNISRFFVNGSVEAMQCA